VLLEAYTKYVNIPSSCTIVFSCIHLNRHTPLTTTLTTHAYSVVPKLCQIINTGVILAPPLTSNCRSQDTAWTYQQTSRQPLETMRTSSLLCKISIFNHHYLLTELLLWKVKPGQFITHCKGSAWYDITSHLALWQSTITVACLARQSLSRQAPLYLADDCPKWLFSPSVHYIYYFVTFCMKMSLAVSP